MTAGSPSASPTGVWVLGGFQTDFARNLTVRGVMSRISWARSSTAPSRRATSPRPTSRSSTSATPSASSSPVRATSAPCRRPSVPTCGAAGTRHEAACASGGVASWPPWPTCAPTTTAAPSYSGSSSRRRPCPATRQPPTSAQRPGWATTTAWARFMWPHVFSAIADEYDRRPARRRTPARHRGAQPRQRPAQPERPDPRLGRPRLGRNAGDRRRPQPGRRGPPPPLRLQPGHRGAPGWFSSPTRGCADRPKRRPVAGIEGWGHRTVGLGLRQKLERDRDELYVLPHVRRAVTDAFDRAHVTLEDVDGFEVHDCFTPTEYLAIDHIGLTGPGESWKAVEDGSIAPAAACRSTERWPHRRRAPVWRERHPHAPRCDQAGQRHRGRLSGRGCPQVRHAQLRWQHRHHCQPRRRRGC